MNSIIQKLAQGSPLTIVALGDSLTQGYLVEKGYLDFLDEMLKEKFPRAEFTIINKGISGDTAQSGLYRLERDVISLKPDLVFIEFGLNDAFVGIFPSKFAETLQEIIQQIQESLDSRIVLVTSVCLENKTENDLMNEFYGVMDLVARENDLPIARVHRYWQKKIDQGVDFRELVLEDMVHPNTKGYKLMAEEILRSFTI